MIDKLCCDLKCKFLAPKDPLYTKNLSEVDSFFIIKSEQCLWAIDLNIKVWYYIEVIILDNSSGWFDQS